MASLIGVGRRPTPILLEEHAQALLRRPKILVGIHGTHDGVCGHADVEVVDEGGKEGVAAEAFVRAEWLSHVSSVYAG